VRFVRLPPAGVGSTFHGSCNVSINLVQFILVGDDPSRGINKVYGVDPGDNIVVQHLLKERGLVYFDKSGVIYFEVTFKEFDSALYWIP
jgi:hypothetical protein